MKKIIALLGLGLISNPALAHDMGAIVLIVFGFLVVLQIMITILDYIFTGKSIKGTCLLTVLFLLGIPLFKLLAFALQSFIDIRGGLFTILIIFSFYIFPLVTKAIIVKTFKDTFKRKMKAENITHENSNEIIVNPK